MYIDKLDDIVNKYSNTYHSTIKMKEINDKDPKFKTGDIVKIKKHKKTFLQKVTLQIGLNKFLTLKKLKKGMDISH